MPFFLCGLDRVDKHLPLSTLHTLRLLFPQKIIQTWHVLTYVGVVEFPHQLLPSRSYSCSLKAIDAVAICSWKTVCWQPRDRPWLLKPQCTHFNTSSSSSSSSSSQGCTVVSPLSTHRRLRTFMALWVTVEVLRCLSFSLQDQEIAEFSEGHMVWWQSPV